MCRTCLVQLENMVLKLSINRKLQLLQVHPGIFDYLIVYEMITICVSFSVFVGTGYRLGQTDSDHVALPDQTPRPNRPNNIDVVVLKLWRQGFSINDGDLRNYEDPANKDFLGSIMKG